MTNFQNMTTEELTNAMEILMRRFETTTDSRTMNLLIGTIERIEKIKDQKSWS